MDPKLPAAASILVATLEKIRNKCRPGYMVSKFVVDWISEATAIAQAINASVAATPLTGADALDARRYRRAREAFLNDDWYANHDQTYYLYTIEQFDAHWDAAIASTEGEKP